MQSVEGKVAVITGGAGGIGRALGLRFGAAGARIVLADIDRKALDEAVAELERRDIEVLGVPTDVADPVAVEALARQTFERFGGAHLLFNNAGILPPEPPGLWDVSMNTWQWGFSVNVYGVLHAIRAFMPRLIAQNQEAHIVNVTSHAGGLLNLGSAAVYCVTKSALGALTETLHYQLRAQNSPIRVTLLFPGPHTVPTGIYQSERLRPAHFPPVPPEPAVSPFRSLDDMQVFMRERFGREREFNTPEEVAEVAYQGVLSGAYWNLPMTAAFESALKAQFARTLERRDPVAPGSEIL